MSILINWTNAQSISKGVADKERLLVSKISTDFKIEIGEYCKSTNAILLSDGTLIESDRLQFYQYIPEIDLIVHQRMPRKNSILRHVNA